MNDTVQNPQMQGPFDNLQSGLCIQTKRAAFHSSFSVRPVLIPVLGLICQTYDRVAVRQPHVALVRNGMRPAAQLHRMLQKGRHVVK